MTGHLEVLGMIGMRSGSIGVADKNVREVAGRPLFAWIVEAARASSRVTRTIVSTDSAEYAELAREHGAEVPYLRPAELAGPDATDVQFITHMLDHLENSEGYRPDVVLRLLATAPLQQPADIDGVVDVLVATPKASSAMVVAEARQHPMKALKIVTDDDGVERLLPYMDTAEIEPRARQRHTPAYHRANIVASRLSTIRETGTLAGDYVVAYVVAQDRAVDIDAELDLEIAAALLERRAATQP